MFEPVVAIELVHKFIDDVYVFILAVYELNEPVCKYLPSYDAVNCEEPLTVPAGIVAEPPLPLNAYLVSNEAVNCDEPLIVPAGVAPTLPLNV